MIRQLLRSGVYLLRPHMHMALTTSCRQHFCADNDLLNKLKQQATFDGKGVVEMAGEQDWTTYVDQATTPVVINIYAKWSEPCKQVTQTLQQLQQDQSWRLINVDLDAFPAVGTTFEVKTIPTVVLLFGNQIIDVIKGVPDEPTLQRFMGILHRMSDAQDLMIHNLRFRTLMDENLVEGAREYVQHVNDCYIMQLIQDPKMSAKLGTLHLWVAATYISENKVDEGREQLRIVETTYAKQLAENQKDKDLHSDLTEWLNQLGKSGADVDPLLIEMLQQLDTDPKNLELRYKIAEHCNSINYHEEAIRQCLDIIKINRSWENRKAQTLLLQIFDALGSQNQLVIEGRKHLQRILY